MLEITQRLQDGLRAHLQNELVSRCRNNPRYSLRALAQQLRLDPSSLSQFLRGQRSFSIKKIETLAAQIGLLPGELAKLAARPDKEEDDVHDLTLETFKAIADWYHYAIFELVTTQGFKLDSRWIAQRLGISATEAHVAIERLLKIGLLRNDGGKIIQGQTLISTAGNPYTATAFRKLQHQLLDKAKVAMEEVDFSERDQTSMTLAISSKQIPEAKEMLKKFRRRFQSQLQSEVEKRDSVYELVISFYPVTKTNKKTKQSGGEIL
jgi:transcriptional regulator with XRE-family HTH domain